MALTDKLTAIADAIRGKTGGTEAMTLDQMPTEIGDIKTDPVLEPLTITENGAYTPGEGVDGFDKVTVEVGSAEEYNYSISWTTMQNEAALSESPPTRPNGDVVVRGKIIGKSMLDQHGTWLTDANIVFADESEVEAIANKGMSIARVKHISFPNLRIAHTEAFLGGSASNAHFIETVYLPKLTVIKDRLFEYQTNMETAQLGSIGYGVTSMSASAFNMVTQATLTITIYCNGDNADTILVNARNGATAATITLIASEDTAYGGTNYAAGETIMTSTVEG